MMFHKWMLSTLAATTLLLAGCAQPLLTASSNDRWTTLFDSNSNLNQWTLVGDANWRIQDEALQADFLRGKAPSYLVTKASYQNM